MTWYKDLEKCDYFGAEISQFLIAVGWFDRDYSFPKGRVSEQVYYRLVELLKDPFKLSFIGMSRIRV